MALHGETQKALLSRPKDPQFNPTYPKNPNKYGKQSLYYSQFPIALTPKHDFERGYLRPTCLIRSPKVNVEGAAAVFPPKHV